jgi:hypothetical protein
VPPVFPVNAPALPFVEVVLAVPPDPAAPTVTAIPVVFRLMLPKVILPEPPPPPPPAVVDELLLAITDAAPLPPPPPPPVKI